MSADRNLLFGILAVQSGFCTGPQLVEAMNAWTLAKHRPLGEILVERAFLKQDEHDLIAALVAKQLERHGGDADKSLAALTPMPRLAAELRRISDVDVQQSLAALPSSHVDDADRTRSFDDSASGGSVRYRILRPHARGGLGEVFVAKDMELGREVALKEIQPEHADRQDSRGRFVREAEVTGALEHPGVVAVYGLGAYADGRPFYAMRFIHGDSLNEAIRRFHAPGEPSFSGTEFRQLLGRFVDVCQAIAYAHSRGVLHRDLKPGNIMLGKFGETLVVDWGLAKVVGTQEVASGDRTLNISSGSGATPTMQGQAIGTPAFMSPEQATGRLDELGPATDVYSLGATLYALLANRAPIESGRVDEMLRKAERGEWTPLRSVNPAIPAPLAAVCAKAMALKPGERYASAEALAADVERYLADEPVSAHPDAFVVRASRWARKHRTTVATAAVALVVAATAMGIGLAVVGDRNTKLATANTKLDEARRDAEGAKDQAVKRLAQVEKSNEILAAVFQDLDIRHVREGDEPLEAVLASRLVKAGEQLEGEAVGDSLVVAKLQDRLGLSLLNLGSTGEAAKLAEKAMDAHIARLGFDHPETLTIMHNFAVGLGRTGKLDQALTLHERTLRQRRAILGAEHPDTLWSMYNLAIALRAVGKLDQALTLHEETLRLRKAKLGPNHPDTLQSMDQVASALQDAGKLNEALRLYQESFKLMSAKLGAHHPDTLASMNNLASGLKAAGKLDQALPLYEESYKLLKAKAGSSHVMTLSNINNLASALQAAGKLDQSLPLFEESYKLLKARAGYDHPDTLASMNNLALALKAAGKLDQALLLLEESFKLLKSKLGPDHAETLKCMSNLALTFQAAGKLDQALPLYEESFKLLKAKLGPDHPATLASMGNLSMGLEAAGKLDQALALDEETLRRKEAKLGADHPETLISMNNLAWALAAVGKLDQALPLFEKTFKLRESKLGPDHPSTLTSMGNLGKAYCNANKGEQAVATLKQFVARSRQRHKSNPLALARALANAALDLLRCRQFAVAEAMLRESAEIYKQTQPDGWSAFFIQSALGAALSHQKKYAEAEPLLVKGYEGMKQRESSIPPQSKKKTSRRSCGIPHRSLHRRQQA